jgi:hypothetical protein
VALVRVLHHQRLLRSPLASYPISAHAYISSVARSVQWLCSRRSQWILKDLRMKGQISSLLKLTKWLSQKLMLTIGFTPLSTDTTCRLSF